MKNILLITTILFAISCDKITEPYEPVSVTDTLACPEPTFPVNTNIKKNILIEDFTGHTCNNCPAAAYIIDTIKHNRGSQIVAIAMHVGNFAEPKPGPKYTTDFRTTEGTQLKQDLLPGAGLPSLMVNRNQTLVTPNSFRVFYLSLPPIINTIINDVPEVNMQIIASFDPVKRTLCAYVETEALVNLSEDYSLVVALTEDSLIDWQLYNGNGGDPVYGTSSGDIEKYKHAHVLRTNLNGTYGKTIITGSATAGDKIINGYSLKNVTTDWDDNHFSVVAYLYKNSTKEVVQVTEIHVD